MLQASTALQKAETSLPFFDHDNQKKRNYLAYRICGFSRLESRQNAGASKVIYDKWLVSDEDFAGIEKQGLLELSRQFRNEIVGLEFTRNFKLCLDKDRIVLQKSVKGNKLTDDEWDYLKKIRPLYTPAALKALEDLVSGVKKEGLGSWDEILLVARKNGEHKEFRNEAIRDQVEELEYTASGWVAELTEGPDGAEDND